MLWEQEIGGSNPPVPIVARLPSAIAGDKVDGRMRSGLGFSDALGSARPDGSAIAQGNRREYGGRAEALGLWVLDALGSARPEHEVCG